ncbi:MAG: acyl carrier protein [Lachnospiraceae bacterium]|nr:acyl carrier protein [Lachnospiraceae bacterium]
MSTFDQVKDIITDTLKFDGEITESSDLFKDLKADSLDAVELVMAVEEAFDIEVPDEDMANLHTVADIVAYVDAHKN